MKIIHTQIALIMTNHQLAATLPCAHIFLNPVSKKLTVVTIWWINLERINSYVYDLNGKLKKQLRMV